MARRGLGNCFAILSLCLALTFSATAAPLETGWLKDEKGSFDPQSKAKVIGVVNMFGSKDENGRMKWQIRYVAIEIPVPGIRATDVVAIDASGNTIKHSDPEAHENATGGTLLKLFFERPAGFSFRLKLGETLAAGSTSAEGVIAAYKSAHAKASVDGLMALVAFQSPDSPLRASWRADFSRDVKSRITSIRTTPFSTYASTPAGQMAKRLPPSVKPAGWFEIEFAAEPTPGGGGSVQRTTLYLIGQEKNAYFIVGP